MKIDEVLLPTIVIVVFILLFAYMFKSDEQHGLEDALARRQYCLGKVVKSVGGCDRFAMCEVLWTDGSYGKMAYPAEGLPCK